MRAWTLTAAALAATLTLIACAEDGPASDPPTGAPEEGHVYQADNAEAYERARALGCTFLESGAVRCPELALLGGNTRFPSVDDMPPPRKPQRLEDQSSMVQALAEMTREALTNPDEYSHFTPHQWNLGRYVLENIEAEDAMARAGCETMEDACADAVRRALGWTGLQSPGTAGMQGYYADKAVRRAARIEAQKERPK